MLVGGGVVVGSWATTPQTGPSPRRSSVFVRIRRGRSCSSIVLVGRSRLGPWMLRRPPCPATKPFRGRPAVVWRWSSVWRIPRQWRGEGDSRSQKACRAGQGGCRRRVVGRACRVVGRACRAGVIGASRCFVRPLAANGVSESPKGRGNNSTAQCQEDSLNARTRRKKDSARSDSRKGGQNASDLINGSSQKKKGPKSASNLMAKRGMGWEMGS